MRAGHDQYMANMASGPKPIGFKLHQAHADGRGVEFEVAKKGASG